MTKFDRRLFLATSMGLFAQDFGRPAKALGSEEFLKLIEKRLGGRAGLAVLDTGSGKNFRWRGDQRFAMCSSFKWLLAACVLARAEQGTLSLDRQISYAASALIGHSPVTAAHVKEGHL